MPNEDVTVERERGSAPDIIDETGTQPAPDGGLLNPQTSTEKRRERTRELLAYGCFGLVAAVALAYLAAAFVPGQQDTSTIAEVRDFVGPFGLVALGFYFAKAS